MSLANVLETLRQGVDDLLSDLEKMRPADQRTLNHPVHLVTQVHTFVVFKANQLAHLMAAEKGVSLPDASSLVCVECFKPMTSSSGPAWHCSILGVNIYTCSQPCMDAMNARHLEKSVAKPNPAWQELEPAGPVCQRKGCEEPAEVDGGYCQRCYSLTFC